MCECTPTQQTIAPRNFLPLKSSKTFFSPTSTFSVLFTGGCALSRWTKKRNDSTRLYAWVTLNNNILLEHSVICYCWSTLQYSSSTRLTTLLAS